jgi:Xaa-Pro dipeptidase
MCYTSFMEPDRLHNLYLQHVDALQRAAEDALAAAGVDALVVHSGRAQKKSSFDDQYWPLRPTPYFLYWAPIEIADCAVIVRPGRRPVLLYNVARDYWEGAPDVDRRVLEAFEVVDVTDPAAARAHLPGGKVAFVGDDLERAAGWGIAAGATNPPALLAALDRRRTRKSPYETACLAEANRIAGLGHAAVRDAFLAGDHSELDLHLLYLRATAQDDAETPYKNIVALGPHAATLHHVHYGRRATAASSLLLDAGATFRGYASDVTRTYVKNAGASPGATAFAALVAGLEKLQQECCARVRPGMRYEALHDQSHELLAGVLREVGIVRAGEDELVKSGVTRLFLPHGLGHSLGVQTHDVGCAQEKPRADNPFLRNTSVIEPDQVFTIEPGCYFIDEKLDALRASPLAAATDWKLVEALRQLGGVRIEDDVVVRAAGQGVDNLTRAALP